ncbi:hypothetical protein [Acidiphilium acidophilum]|nr:hypothetical protein [Acidiphilium acidophilum]
MKLATPKAPSLGITMYVLTTIFGTILAFDGKKMGLVHCDLKKLGRDIQPIYLDRNPKPRLLLKRASGYYSNIHLDAPTGFRSLPGDVLETDSGKFDHSLSIKGSSGYVTYRPDGGINVDTLEKSDWESFYPVDSELFAYLQEISWHDWVFSANKLLARSSEIGFSGSNKFRISELNLDLAQDNQFMSIRRDHIGNGILSLDLNSNVWRFDRLKRYNPLVVFVLFGSGEIEKQFISAVTSLVRIGNYNDKILLITDKTPHDIETLMILLGKINIMIKIVSALDRTDQVSARLMLAEIDEISDHQPILYADLDIIFDNDIEKFLVDLLFSDKMTAQQEEFQNRLDGASVGAELFNDDPIQVENTFGFNSGLMGFPNMEICASILSSTKKLLTEYCRIHGRNGLTWADQAAINYVAAKFDAFDPEPLTRLTRVPFHHDQFDQNDRRGFVHFWHFGPNRAIAMTRYLQSLLMSSDVYPA